MKIKTLLDELDGDGIIWEDSDLTESALNKLGLSHETLCLFLKNGDRRKLIDALLAFRVISIGNCDDFCVTLADRALAVINQDLDE